jgi:hypothetical protein
MEILYQSLVDAKNIFNKYEDDVMRLSIDRQLELAYLHINERHITNGDPLDVLKRVNQILRERGLDFFEV